MVTIEKTEKHYRVTLIGVDRLGGDNTADMGQQLTEVFQPQGLSVILDLGAVKYIDSAGFEWLLRLNEQAKERDIRFKLCNVSEHVAKLIILMDLEGIFSVCSCENADERVLLVLE